MDAVNLLPPEYRSKGRKRTPVGESLDGRRTLRIGAALAVVLAAAVAAIYIQERSVVSSKKSDLAKAQARLAAVQAQVSALKAAQAAATARLAVVSAVSGARMKWDRALDDFARVTPTDSALTTLSLAAPNPTATVAAGAPAAGTSTLTIAGTAPGTVGVARVLDRYAVLPWLSNVTLTSASRGETGSFSFNITATVSQER